MQTPKIHLNGTCGPVLHREYDDAREAIQRALDRLREVTVHGRDYYTLAPGAIQTALEEHRRRIRDVTRVRDELEQIALDIQLQIEGRRR